MTIQNGTATAEQMIRETPRGLRVGFRVEDGAHGIETLYALHPVTREIRVRTKRIGEDQTGAAWRETHHIPLSAEYVGRCENPFEAAYVRFVA